MKRWWLAAACTYAVLLIASHAVQRLSGSMWTPPADAIGARAVEIPTPRAEGSGPGTIRLSYLAAGGDNRRPPIVLLHGSPGQAYDFAYQRDDSAVSLLDRLASDGRRVYAVDLPGFGHSEPWPPDYSSKANARALVSMLDAMGHARAHVVCWSNSGGAGLWMAELAPDRVASLTLMAAVGAQETEGSGSYWFEHAKYALGMPVVVGLPEVLPHFGLLGPTSLRHAFIRSFLDTDQRPLADIMRRTRTPTLILHGRDDFLISAWAAEEHHRMMPSSRLVMMDAMHFMPFLQPAETAATILGHAQRHDTPGVKALTGVEDRAPRAVWRGPAGWAHHLGEHVRKWPWWMVAALAAVGARRRPETTTMTAGLFVGSMYLDFGVALFGLLIGRFWRGRELPGQRRGWCWTLRTIGWAVVSLVLASTAGGAMMAAGDRAGGWMVVPGVAAGVLGLRLVRHIWTRLGRARIAGAWSRTVNHEWWPSWVIYLPTVLSLPVLAVRGRGILAFTACNPGIERGGGFVGESKSAIMARLPAGGDRVLRTISVAAGGGERAAGVLSIIESDPDLGGYPVIIKPDAGQRGVGVRLARGPGDIRAFLETHGGAAVLQRFHAGPFEAGVFWMRKRREDDPRAVGERDGFISSITLKKFQFLVGDGNRTIGRLISDHPRYRCQMRLFFQRFADRLDEVLPEGERLALSFLGNHAQGTRFAEGGHLATPELEAAVNELARSFDGGGLDYGRFDVRYSSEAALARGEGFAVLEVNGTTSEPTNIYDPAHGPVFAWRTIRTHWRHMYRIGRERVETGARPMSVWRFVLLVVRGR